MASRLITLLCALAGFGLMAAGLRRIAPPHVPEVSPKLEHLRAHPNAYDTLFIGSSRVYHGFDPREFDAAMARAGRPSASFNLGIDGMMPPESLAMARTVAGMRLPRLRRVLLEAEYTRGVPDAEPPTVRGIYWQDARALAEALRRAWRDHATLPANRRGRAWDDAGRALSLFARNQFNIGRLAPVPAFSITKREKPDMVMLGPAGDGYVPVYPVMPAADAARMREEMRRIDAGQGPTRAVDPINIDAFADAASRFAAKGVRVYIVATPTGPRGYGAKREAPPGAPLLAFDEWRAHPELFVPEHRFDLGHLNNAGATIFSRELAAACAGQ